jgi:universal stress protein A
MKLTTRRSRKTTPALSSDEFSLPPIQVGSLNPKKMLVPVDFTECSVKAVTYAVSLAKHFDSEIILLHVAPLGPPTPSAEFVALQGVMIDEQIRDDAVNHLTQWRDRVAAHVPVRALVSSGVSIQDEIVATARKYSCDLIVIATHALGGLAHFLTGSVTEKVVHHAPCPVFVVREREHDFIQSRAQRRRQRTLVATRE